MPNIVRHKEFKKVVDALWSKIKTNFITDITYNPVDRTLNKTKNNLNEEITKVVTEWKDLDYTTQSSIKNIFDKNTQVEDKKYYFVGTGYIKNENWCMATIPCGSEKQFTIVKMTGHDSKHFAFINESGTIVGALDATYQIVGGKAIYKITIPNDLTDVAYFTVNMYKQTVTPDKVMVFSGHIENGNIPTNYVPFTGGATVFIDSNEVALSFDGTGTNLSSSTVHSAIKELNGKITTTTGSVVRSVNGKTPNPQGRVDVEITDIQGLQDQLNSKINTSQIGNKQGNIPIIGVGDKLETSIIPDLAITSVQVVNEKSDAQNLVTSNSIQVGDVVVITNDKNSVYMYNGASQATFDANFVGLSLGEGTIKVINNQRPNSTGVLTLNGTHIDANVNGSNTTIQNHLTTIKNDLATANTRIQANALKSNNNETEILKLKRKHPVYHVGDIVTTTYKTSDTYEVDDFEFLYMGRQKLISRDVYSELFNALGVSSTQSTINSPLKSDTTLSYDIGKNATVRHYICARKVR